MRGKQTDDFVCARDACLGPNFVLSRPEAGYDLERLGQNRKFGAESTFIRVQPTWSTSRVNRQDALPYRSVDPMATRRLGI
jgi:hypothetical protein